MSVSLVSNAYLEDHSSKIRPTKVPWEVGSPASFLANQSTHINQGYQRAGLVTSEELALIKKVAQQSKAKNEPLLLSDGQTYALLYLRLLKKLQRVDTMQCILVLMADALAGTSMFTWRRVQLVHLRT